MERMRRDGGWNGVIWTQDVVVGWRRSAVMSWKGFEVGSREIGAEGRGWLEESKQKQKAKGAKL